ncbi:hypothetical protein CSAL01_11140 [Colletotrichum salicis]|uniref:Uncharacterized protein n=1 Tax=Colletotrichum salicis TaxID=1209931 RepID=A0A135UMA6_9PEZI|nr:hypothetical protein CSAL01_11140 [Colletotrichum salicis]
MNSDKHRSHQIISVVGLGRAPASDRLPSQVFLNSPLQGAVSLYSSLPRYTQPSSQLEPRHEAGTISITDAEVDPAATSFKDETEKDVFVTLAEREGKELFEEAIVTFQEYVGPTQRVLCTLNGPVHALPA